MDEEIEEQLVEVAKLELGIEYEFTWVQKSIFLKIHGAYLNWDDSQWTSLSDIYSEYIKLEEASKKYLATINECPVKDLLPNQIKELVEKNIWWFRFFRQAIEDDIKLSEAKGMENPYTTKRGRKRGARLHFYISQMAGWYEEFFGKKPGYGTSSVFLRLIGACLAVVEGDPDKDPPYKVIRNTLQLLRKHRGEGAVMSWD